jgi:hypothetical protein
MSCMLELWQHGSRTGNRAIFFNSDDGDPMTTEMNKVNDEDTSAEVTGDCAWVIMEHPEGNGGGGFIVDPGEYVPNLRDSNHHGEGKGSTNHRFYKRGDRVNRVIRLTPPTDGYYDDIDIYFKRSDSLGQWGHFPWVTEDLLNNPNTSSQLITSHTDTGQPCPGAAKASIIGHRKYRCTYNTEAQITNLKSGIQGKTGGDPRLVMYNNIVQKFCDDSENTFKAPGGRPCHEVNTGRAIAIEYCGVGSRIKGGLTGGDPNCTTQALGDNYAILAAAYCNTSAGRADTFCKCHNVTNGVCDTDSTAAGCAKKKQTFDKLVDATPSGQKDVWSGMESCFGQVCTGTGVFIPANVNQNCDKSVNVCIQDIDIGSMTDANIQATCDIDAGGPPSVDEPPASSPAQESAQTELEEAKAAVARGDPGAQERLEAAEAALEAAGETGPKAYIPKSLDGLKNDRKQQIGAGVAGALILGCMMMLLLLVASAGGGGGGGPVKRRFR